MFLFVVVVVLLLLLLLCWVVILDGYCGCYLLLSVVPLIFIAFSIYANVCEETAFGFLFYGLRFSLGFMDGSPPWMVFQGVRTKSGLMHLRV